MVGGEARVIGALKAYTFQNAILAYYIYIAPYIMLSKKAVARGPAAGRGRWH